MLRAFAVWLLAITERFYLRAHGWTRVDDGWNPPDGYPKAGKFYSTQAHAVNSQRYWQRHPKIPSGGLCRRCGDDRVLLLRDGICRTCATAPGAFGGGF